MENKELHRISSTAIIYKKDGEVYKYLITRRSLDKKAFPGLWTVPGGGLTVDDYINLPADSNGQWYFAVDKSLRREIKEEVNLEVGDLKYLCDITFIRPDGVPILILSYYGEYKSGKVELDADSIDHKWATIEEIGDYKLIDGILDEIKMVDEKLIIAVS